MAEGLAPYYMLRNYGLRRNCTLTALFPAVVSVVAVEVGEINESVRYVSILVATLIWSARASASKVSYKMLCIVRAVM